MNKKILKNQIILFKNLFKKKHILKESAALTFTTILEIVPFLIFILFIIPKTPFLEVTSKVREILLKIFLPKSIDTITVYIKSFLSSRFSYNIINFVFVLITSYSLFTAISNTFDNILNVHNKQRPSIMTRLTKFLGTIFLGSLFIALITSSISIVFVGILEKYPIIDILSRYLVPFFVLFLALLFTYASIPTINLRATSILYTSAITSIIWVLTKAFFNIYIEYLTNVEIVYGVLASIPIFMLWIYINWIIILSGVIVVSILEKRYHYPQSSLQTNTVRIIVEKDFNNKNEIVFKDVLGKNEMFEKILRLIKNEK